MQKQKIWKAENIIGLVPDELLDNLSLATGVDYSVQKLYGKAVFKLFLFAFLNGGGISLRILAAISQSERFKNLKIYYSKVILLNYPKKSKPCFSSLSLIYFKHEI